MIVIGIVSNAPEFVPVAAWIVISNLLEHGYRHNLQGFYEISAVSISASIGFVANASGFVSDWALEISNLCHIARFCLN